MALRLNGNLVILKTFLYNSSNLITPSFFNIQVRHARRKGYREKAEALKKKAKFEKLQKVVVVEKKFLKSKFKNVEKTIDPVLPDPPKDDVFILKNFKPIKYSLPEAIKFHKEYHHPTMFNNPHACIEIRMEFDMTKKKGSQMISPFNGIAAIPCPFSLDISREILVFCGQEDVDEALAAGAKTCGGKNLVAKVKEGAVQLSSFEYILCHVDFLPELTPIRGLLKTQMPRLKNGTLTEDLPKAIKRFLNGVEYKCIIPNISNKFGFVDCKVGTIEMNEKDLEENFKAVLKDVHQFKPPRDGDFVTWVWCFSPPSPEKFAIDLSLYLGEQKVKAEDEEEEYDEQEERKKIGKK